MAALPDRLIYTVIANGFGRMPPYAAQLTDRERWAVIAWLRRLQQTPTAAPDERADSIRGALIRAEDSLRAARPRGVLP
jgi:mono/diheme cytochrome c family protein